MQSASEDSITDADKVASHRRPYTGPKNSWVRGARGARLTGTVAKGRTWFHVTFCDICERSVISQMENLFGKISQR